MQDNSHGDNKALRSKSSVLTWERNATAEGITSKVFGTIAHRIVIVHLTQGIDTTYTHTRIAALLLNACKILRALRVDDALRTTVRWSTVVTWKTLAHWVFLNYLAIRVGPTGTGITWVYIWTGCRKNFSTEFLVVINT